MQKFNEKKEKETFRPFFEVFFTPKFFLAKFEKKERINKEI